MEKILNELTNNGVQEISKEIETTKKEVKEQLISFYNQYNEELPFFKFIANKNKDEINKEIQLHVEKIVNSIKWPDAQQLLENFKLETYYSDITFEDLNNIELINELKSRGLINAEDNEKLSTFSQGVELNKSN